MTTPLHPALVHVPLGLAFILPALAIGFSWAVWKRRVQPRAWISIVVLEAVLLGAGLVALKTGQNEEDRVEKVVPESALATHEERAEQFLWVTGITLAVAASVLLASRSPLAVRALTATTVLGTLLVAAAAVRVGHAGGQLVYVHNAPAAYASGKPASAATAGDSNPSRVAESGAARDDDDAK